MFSKSCLVKAGGSGYGRTMSFRITESECYTERALDVRQAAALMINHVTPDGPASPLPLVSPMENGGPHFCHIEL